jgi:transcription termination factor 2
MMLVLLLRLRQVCSHPALIQTMLDTTDTEAMGSEEAKIEDNDLDLITQMSTMTLGGESDEPKKEEANFFTHTNPVFDRENMSSKMRYITNEVKKIVDQKQKAVVVSQWTSMLDLFAQHFRRMRIRCHLIAGSVAIKHRTEIVEDFNGNPDGAPVRFFFLCRYFLCLLLFVLFFYYFILLFLLLFFIFLLFILFLLLHFDKKSFYY